MTAHVIVDAFRQHPNETLIKELESQDIRSVIWEGIHDPASVVNSIAQSHKLIVKYAKDHGMPEICILEEDVMFTAPGAWEYFLDNKPASFDLYLGGCYGLDEAAYNRISEANGPTQINSFAGLHCYVISENYYNRFLDLPKDRHIDDQRGLGLFYVCSPFVALQHPGWSSNNKEKVNYNDSTPPKCIYNGKR